MRPRVGILSVCALLATGSLLTGCEPLHRQHVRKVPPLIAEDINPDADVSNLAPETKGFFKNDRSTGTWSPEAREIEKHFGATDF
jgi:hypothetical protein